jgi:hypothetical protein
MTDSSWLDELSVDQLLDGLRLSRPTRRGRDRARPGADLDPHGMSQRPLAEQIGRTQSWVSKHLPHHAPWSPRPLPAVNHQIAHDHYPPLLEHSVRDLELWCAYRSAALGWVPSFQHPVRFHPAGEGLCDVVLSLPGTWEPCIAIEVKKAIKSPSELTKGLQQLHRYTDGLGYCVTGVLIADEVDPRYATDEVYEAFRLEHAVGRCGPPYQPEVAEPPRGWRGHGRQRRPIPSAPRRWPLS